MRAGADDPARRRTDVMTGMTGDVIERPAAVRKPSDRRVPRWINSYRIVAALTLGYVILATLQKRWAGDFQLHQATLWAIIRDPWHPTDPMVGDQPGSPYFSPYTVGLGLVARLLGRTPTEVLAVAGVLAVAAVLWAFRRFLRWWHPSPAAAAIAWLATLTLWGLTPRAWSGFLDLFSLRLTAPYPSTIATALMLLAWDTLLRYRARGRTIDLAVLTVLTATVVLIHPFTGLNTILGLAAIAVWRPYDWRPATLARLAVAGVVATGAALAWPYFNVWHLLAAPDDFSYIHRGLALDLLSLGGLGGYGLALAGLPALVARARRDVLDPLVVLFVLAGAIVTVAMVAGTYGYLRVLPVVMLPLHAALGAHLAGRIPASRADGRRRRLYRSATAILCGVGLWAQGESLLLALPIGVLPESVRTDYAAQFGPQPFTFLNTYLRPGDVVVSDDMYADRAANGLGALSVLPGWPDPSIRDRDHRLADVYRVFDPLIPVAERSRALDRHGVRCIIDVHHPPLQRPGVLPDTFARVAKGPTGVLLFCRANPGAVNNGT